MPDQLSTRSFVYSFYTFLFRYTLACVLLFTAINHFNYVPLHLLSVCRPTAIRQTGLICLRPAGSPFLSRKDLLYPKTLSPRRCGGFSAMWPPSPSSSPPLIEIRSSFPSGLPLPTTVLRNKRHANTKRSQHISLTLRID
ncbi:protein of unknown function [Candidatus Methylomirabilis oxygeniifera]|uniref:Uncharacterized protein n=1 Tax=Methylomirabilis oxygeniifera TaxID=671143 RepID=D5MF43_METO1|nr:protein of unknown function [Candidatus Methylomirabilis oxyfera]